MLIVFVALALIGSVVARHPTHLHDDVVKDEPIAAAAAAAAASPHPAAAAARSLYQPSRQLYGVRQENQFGGGGAIRRHQPIPSGRVRRQPPKSIGERRGRRARRQAMFVIDAADSSRRDIDEYVDDNLEDAVQNEHTAARQPAPLVDRASSPSGRRGGGVKDERVEPASEKRNDASAQRAPHDRSDDRLQRSSNVAAISRARAPSATVEGRKSFSRTWKADVDETPAAGEGESNADSYDEDERSSKDFAEDGAAAAAASTTADDVRTSVRKDDDDDDDESISSDEDRIVTNAIRELLRRRGIVYDGENVPAKGEIEMIEGLEKQMNEQIDEMLSTDMSADSYEEFVGASSDLAWLQRYRRRLQTRRENLVREVQLTLYTPTGEEETSSSEDSLAADVIVDEFVRQRGITPADEFEIVAEMLIFADKRIAERVSSSSSSKAVSSDDARLEDVSSYVAEMKRFRSRLLNRRGKLLRELSRRNEDTPPVERVERTNEESATTGPEAGGYGVDSSVSVNEDGEARTSTSGRTSATTVTDEIDSTTQSGFFTRLLTERNPQTLPPPPTLSHGERVAASTSTSTSTDPGASTSDVSDESEYSSYEDSGDAGEPVEPTKDGDDKVDAVDVPPVQGVPKDDIEREPSFKAKLFDMGMGRRVPYSERFL